MPSNIKPLSTPVDIQSAANTVSDATLVSVLNTSTSPALVVVTETGNGVYLKGGERIAIVKDPSHSLDGTDGDSSIWASSIAYKA